MIKLSHFWLVRLAAKSFDKEASSFLCNKILMLILYISCSRNQPFLQEVLYSLMANIGHSHHIERGENMHSRLGPGD